MKARYIGDYYKVRLHKDKIYDVLSVEKLSDGDWFEIMGEDGDQGFFPAGLFEVVE